METQMAVVVCDTCDGRFQSVPYADVTLVCNKSTQKWTYAYLCTGCGRRQVHDLYGELVLAFQSLGSPVLVTEDPNFSLPRGDYSSETPPIDEVDLADFIASLNTHDYLASYAL